MMRTMFKHISLVALVLLLGACASPYNQRLRPLVGANTPMECESAVSTQNGYEIDCRGKDKLTRAEALEALRQADALNAPPVNFSLFGINSAYPYVITRGRFDPNNGPKYIYRGYSDGYVRHRFVFRKH